MRNAGARAGDVLVLTKPLGFGILTTALKRDLVSEPEIEDAVEVAATLNKSGRAALREVEVSAATDVTGYGFLGHLSEMLEASGLGAVVRRSEVPVWERSDLPRRGGVLPWRPQEQPGVPRGEGNRGRGRPGRPAAPVRPADERRPARGRAGASGLGVRACPGGVTIRSPRWSARSWRARRSGSFRKHARVRATRNTRRS